MAGQATSEMQRAAWREILRRRVPDPQERQRLAGGLLGGRPPQEQRCTKRIGKGGNTGRFCWGWRVDGTDRCWRHPRPEANNLPAQEDPAEPAVNKSARKSGEGERVSAARQAAPLDPVEAMIRALMRGRRDD
jgi:hypothetical protein